MTGRIADAEKVYEALCAIVPDLPPMGGADVFEVVVTVRAGEAPTVCIKQWVRLRVGPRLKTTKFKLVPDGELIEEMIE